MQKIFWEPKKQCTQALVSLVKTFPISLVDMKYHLAWLAQNLKVVLGRKIERSAVLIFFMQMLIFQIFGVENFRLGTEEDIILFFFRMMNDFYAWQRRHWTVYILLPSRYMLHYKKEVTILLHHQQPYIIWQIETKDCQIVLF